MLAMRRCRAALPDGRPTVASIDRSAVAAAAAAAQVIILIEDNVRFYSSYLPQLYSGALPCCYY